MPVTGLKMSIMAAIMRARLTNTLYLSHSVKATGAGSTLIWNKKTNV